MITNGPHNAEDQAEQLNRYGQQTHMLAAPIKTLIKSALRALSLEVQRIDPHAAPPPIYHCVNETQTKINSGQDAAYLCPISELCTFSGFTLSPGGWHPFVAPTTAYLHGHCKTYAGSALESFYRSWQPKNALEALIAPIDGPSILRELPAYTAHVPWLPNHPEERRVVMEKNILDENRWAGKVHLDASGGYGLQGPVSLTKAEIEYARIVELADSIKRHGFDRSRAEEDITVAAIERDGEHRFCISHGQHRAAVLAALGHERVPVSFIRLVSLSEAQHWPQVYRGIWSLAQAQTYVNHLFDFDAYAWARARGLAE